MTETIQEGLGAVEMKRSFSAPVEVVYRAFTETDALAKWGMGHSYDNLALDIDVRPGGVYFNRVLHKESGVEWTFVGVYQEVERNQRLSYTFDWKADWREPPTPSLVELTFHDRGDTMELEVTHSQMPEPGVASTEEHWAEFLDTLEQMLVSKELS
ncbi:MAG: SRPBCC family protein [Anaerolineae bacterium]|nr:MAG: SRPBCC family protein [Anaerolineae bacterium]